jgi:SNF2 family DNA or RNA helicase
MVRNGDAELEPIAWDDGPSWTLEVAIESDASNALYRIDAKVVRDGEALPLGEIESVVGGIVFSRRRASRFDDRGHGAWLNALRANGPIEVPHRDAEAFREALVRAPIANIALPPELGWTYVDVPPQPVLALAHDSWASEMHGELLFQYDEWRVSSQSQERQKTFGRRLIRRDRSREEGLRARVAHAGAIVTWNGLRVRQSQLEALVRSLTAEGWSIEIESKPVRLADALDLEISSGIDWFDLEVRASFGDDRELRLPQLLAASEAKRSLVHLSDGSYGILPDGWDEPLSSLADYGTKRDDAFRFRPSQALLVDALLGSKANVDAPFERWRERISGAEPMPREEPKSLRAKLRPYQQAGLGWLHFLRESGLGGCLADDMGLGKTVQALALLEGLRASGSTRPSLVVAPRSLLFNWSAEAKRFAPELRVVEHHGAGRDLDAMGDCDVVLTTYATMRLDIAQLSSIEFEYAILDEAQAIKNASSQVAKATRLLRAQHRLALSGTPIENHLGELWSLFEFLNPGLLGTSRAFSRTFASKSVSPERRAALARALRPLILRRTKDQVAPELPARIEQTRLCELEGKQKKLYVELREHYRQALLGRVQQSGIEKSRMQILEALLRLRQAACAPALIDPSTDAPSAKLELLMSELREVLDAGHRALVFSQFTSFLALVQRELDAAGMAYLYLDGKTKNRQALVERFQSVDGPPLFLISLKAGGLGLNLTNADYIFLLDPWWNPAVEAQAIDRAHRIGRQKPVVAYRLIARDTVEEKILELQSRKRELAESIISQDNSVLRKLELEDLELLLG